VEKKAGFSNETKNTHDESKQTDKGRGFRVLAGKVPKLSGESEIMLDRGAEIKKS